MKNKGTFMYKKAIYAISFLVVSYCAASNESCAEGEYHKSQRIQRILDDALEDETCTVLKKIINNGFDVNEKLLLRSPLQQVLDINDHKIASTALEILLEAGARWPLSRADNYIIDGVEFTCHETITQSLKSQWMLGAIPDPRMSNPVQSLKAKQMLPIVDALELKFKLKEQSDLLIFCRADKDLSIFDRRCKGLAYAQAYQALIDGDLTQLRTTLDLGIDPNYRDKKGMSLLVSFCANMVFYSSDELAEEILLLLLKPGARWTENEFSDADPNANLQLHAKTLSEWLAINAEMYELIGRQNPEDEKLNGYAKRCKKLVSFLSEHDL
jgi:hypothetical protein